MATSRVKVHKSVEKKYQSKWTLCFQWVTYIYNDGTGPLDGYRFIWKRPNGSLQSARGQARIPNAADLLEMLQKATAAGWFNTIENIASSD